MTVLFEWLAREGHLLLLWWLWMTLAGAAAFPLCIRLLAGLPDKGWTLARPVGMLLVAFVFWLLASGGFFDNSAGSMVFAWLLVGSLSLLVYLRFGSHRSLLEWWRENRRLFLLSELLFFCLFVGWAIYRAHQNQILYTEKPMELAFMSAVQRSPAFPPHDPWLSGYAISYYYLGYVMSAMLATLSGITSTIGFNLTIASQFALTGLGAFGVVYNLVRSRAFEAHAPFRSDRQLHGAAAASGLLGMLLLILVGNFQMPLIEAPFQSESVPASYLEYWGTQDRSRFPADGSGYAPRDDAAPLKDPLQWTGWWWFRASRVLTDYALDGTLQPIQPIDEFPAFSFLLADSHPHVLALPFVVMTIGMMLNLVLLRRHPSRAETLLYAITVGGLVFLNTWDGPIYLLGLLGAEALRRLMLNNNKGHLDAHDWLGLFKFAVLLAGIAVIAYLPFLVGFRSQAGGLLPNLQNPTLFRRFFIMFGPFVLILPLFILTEIWRGRRLGRLNWRLGLSAAALLLLALVAVMLGLSAVVGINLPGYPPGDWSAVIGALLERRVEYGLTAVLLLSAIAGVVARLFPLPRPQSTAVRITYPAASGLALLLTGIGLCLTLLPEFFYLQDNFAARINTIFKFYYQAWVVWSIAAAYAAYSILGEKRLPRPGLGLRLLTAAALLLILAAGLLYSALGVHHRAWNETGRVYSAQRPYAPPADWDNPIPLVASGSRVLPGSALYSNGSLRENPQAEVIRATQGGVVEIVDGIITLNPALTLDGRESIIDPDDLRVIDCLNAIAAGKDVVAVEAVRDAYSAQYGRVGALTGIPIVLGWENHERQWRGATYDAVAGTRRSDVDRLYSAMEFDIASEIIEEYGIDYILYGTTERAQYGSSGEGKFLDYLPVVCEAGSSRIFYAAAG